MFFDWFCSLDILTYRNVFVSPAMLYIQFDIYTHKIQKLGVTLLFLQIIKKSNMEDFYGH